MTPLIPPDEAAELLSISVRTLKSHVDAGELRYVSLGRGLRRERRMFALADLEAFIQTKLNEPKKKKPRARVVRAPVGGFRLPETRRKFVSNPEKHFPPGTQIVYFLKSGDSVKIGRTKNLERRVDALKTGAAFGLTLILATQGDNDLERGLHHRLREYRRNGEWFRLEGDLFLTLRGWGARI